MRLFHCVLKIRNKTFAEPCTCFHVNSCNVSPHLLLWTSWWRFCVSSACVLLTGVKHFVHTCIRCATGRWTPLKLLVFSLQSLDVFTVSITLCWLCPKTRFKELRLLDVTRLPPLPRPGPLIFRVLSDVVRHGCEVIAVRVLLVPRIE